MQFRGVAAGAFALVCGVMSLVASPAAAGEVFAGVATHDVDIHVAKCCYETAPDVQIGAVS